MTRRSFFLAPALALMLGLGGGAGRAAGQGISIGPQSACMSGRIDAGVARPCRDASAVYYNPAGVATLPSAVSVGGSAIITSNDFVYDSTGVTVHRPTQTALVPNAYATTRLLDGRLGLGLGVNAPFGLSLKWPVSFEGRFAGYDNKLQSIFVQPTVAYQLIPGRLAVGGGLDVVFTTVRIEQRVDLAGQLATTLNGVPVTFGQLGVPLGTDFADLTLDGHATSMAGNFGILLTPSDRVSFGVRYETSTTIKVDNASATFRQVATNLTLPPNNPFGLPGGTPLDELLTPQFVASLADQSLSTQLVLPAMVVAGVDVLAAPGLHVSGDYEWTDWSSFKSITLNFERAPTEDLVFDWKNTSTYRLGAAYAASPKLTLRAGFSYNDAAEPAGAVSPLLPEGPRNEYTAGLGYDITPRFTVNAYYILLDQADRRGRLVARTSQTNIPPDRGIFTSQANLFGLALTWHPGGGR